MDTELGKWMSFIAQIGEREVKNAMSKNKEIKKAQKEYEYLVGDEAERRLAFLREKAIRDETSIYDAGYHKGEELGEKKGEKKGKKNEKIEIAKKMKQKGMDIAIIIEITGLTEEEIKEL